MDSLVSVIIPHWNRADLLEESVASIRAQTHEQWEVLIVDDGSDDDEWTRVQRMADGDKVLVFRRAGESKGPSTCRNEGLARARGDFVVFLDSDDLLAPSCLQARLDVFAGEPAADFHVFQAQLFRERAGDCDLLWNRLDGTEDLRRFLGSDPPWCVTSPIWRREALRRLGGFNPRVVYGDDTELHARALLSGLRHVKHPDTRPDCFIRRGTAGRLTGLAADKLSSSRFVRLEEMQRLVDRYRLPRSVMESWSGEYFTEAEFLLFNLRDSWSTIRPVLNLWRSRMTWRPWWMVALPVYFALGSRIRGRFYLGVRIMRRIMMVMMPHAFFVRTTTFHSMPVGVSIGTR